MLTRGIKRTFLSSLTSLKTNKTITNLSLTSFQCRFKTWSSSDPEKLQKMTEQALIHDISLHQLETVKEVVPWFLKSMPVSLLSFISFSLFVCLFVNLLF